METLSTLHDNLNIILSNKEEITPYIFEKITQLVINNKVLTNDTYGQEVARTLTYNLQELKRTNNQKKAFLVLTQVNNQIQTRIERANIIHKLVQKELDQLHQFFIALETSQKQSLFKKDNTVANRMFEECNKVLKIMEGKFKVHPEFNNASNLLVAAIATGQAVMRAQDEYNKIAYLNIYIDDLKYIIQMLEENKVNLSIS